MEDEIFKARYEKEQMFKRRDKERKKREKMKTPHWTPNRPSTATNGKFEFKCIVLLNNYLTLELVIYQHMFFTSY